MKSNVVRDPLREFSQICRMQKPEHQSFFELSYNEWTLGRCTLCHLHLEFRTLYEICAINTHSNILIA